jgi:peptidoglycan/xylan/chitin deacetylase (PgdA/CDA1 family)
MNGVKLIQHRPSVKLSRLLKFVVSFLVHGVDALHRLVLKISGGQSRGTCVVLYYHSVPPEQRALFAKQLDTILQIGQVIDITREVLLEPSERRIGITFDDAFENFVSEALPELQKRRVPATLFVITNALGKAFGPSKAPERVMTARQLLGLPSDLISVGSHTVTHPYLPELDELAARQELTESKSTLEQLLGREITSFSFPFGGFTDRLIQLASEAGYRTIFTTLPGFAFRHDPRGSAIGRVRVDPTDWPLEYRLKLAGAYRWLPLAISLKGRLKELWESPVKDSDTPRTRSQIQEPSRSRS